MPPITLQLDKGRPFDLATLVEESHSHVYLVRLLTFDPTADGRAYYKIGKAISIPKRIKQFGPCELIAEAQLPSEKESLAFEAQLHQQFDQWRKPETEIFCFTVGQVEAVIAAMTATGCHHQKQAMASCQISMRPGHPIGSIAYHVTNPEPEGHPTAMR